MASTNVIVVSASALMSSVMDVLIVVTSRINSVVVCFSLILSRQGAPVSPWPYDASSSCVRRLGSIKWGSCCMALSSSIHSQSSGKHFELQPSEWDPGLCPVVFRVFLISQMSSLLPLCKYYSFFNYSTQVLPNPLDLWKMFPVKNS